ncbi:hypothetical protein Tco_0626299 [Tanacetum coccineum]|uniref:Uncharacterized protein n=1 Tax=Tanacetum coccineum TaxID=301880 RepID=A0ABQ4WJ57_9ASTR
MVAYLQKSEGSEGFHQIMDFLNTCHIKYALIENPTIYVSLIEQFSSNIATAIICLAINRTFNFSKLIFDGMVKNLESVDDIHGGVATTVSGLEAGQGSGNIHKTPTMPYDSPLLRVHTLGSDEGRMQPNELMELVTKLLDRVAVLKNDLKQTKKTYGRGFFQSGEEIAKIDKDLDISLVQQMVHHDAQTQGRQEYDLEPNFEFTAPEEVYTAEPDINTANVPVSTASAEVSTAAESLVYIRRSAAKRKDKEERQRIASVYEEASTFKPEEWDNIQAQIEANEELADKLQAQERERYSEADKAKLLHMGRHTLQLLRGYSFNEIKVLFEATVKRVNTFTPKESDNTVPKVIAGSSKRSAEEELDMLKNFNRDDLVKLWDLVRERFSSTEPTNDKERALWVELKRLFEPDTDDLLELQRYMHDPLT